MNNIHPQDQPQLIPGITRDSSASILLEKGIKSLRLFFTKFCDLGNTVNCREN